ncbi:hypothetical protein BLOT_001003, partial [Blomia tropicalis]
YQSVESRSSLMSRIVGGVRAQIGEIPYQVALLRSGSFVCGGSLIGSHYVLTAAHCVFGNEDEPSLFTVRYGTVYRNSGFDIDVNMIRRHPSYSPETFDYDVAVLCLANNYVPGINAEQISLAKSSPTIGSSVILSGWGLLSTNGNKLPLFLQKSNNLTIISNEECQQKCIDHNITDRMLCAFSRIQSSCIGDSGGPMVQHGVLMGVISWGSTWCLHPTHPTVYANVVNLRQWIVENMVDVSNTSPKQNSRQNLLLLIISLFLNLLWN